MKENSNSKKWKRLFLTISRFILTLSRLKGIKLIPRVPPMRKANLHPDFQFNRREVLQKGMEEDFKLPIPHHFEVKKEFLSGISNMRKKNPALKRILDVSSLLIMRRQYFNFASTHFNRILAKENLPDVVMRSVGKNEFHRRSPAKRRRNADIISYKFKPLSHSVFRENFYSLFFNSLNGGSSKDIFSLLLGFLKRRFGG